MPFRQRGFFRGRRNRLGTIVDSNKNVKEGIDGIVASTNLVKIIAVAVDSATNTVTTQVERGCHIYRIWLEFWAYTTDTTDTTAQFNALIGKNPGANLTLPNPGTVGSSNEKKFVFKEWKGLLAAKSQGGLPYTWKGWIKVPKVYQRMGADDTIDFVVRIEGVAGNICHKAIYKWFK